MVNRTKRCFVISPIGLPNSSTREDADAVLDYIVQPALDELGIEAIRADKLAEPGLITDQVLAAILEYDLCVVDLSGHNPNVFYELALAQAAERPVVILKRAGEPIPFDVKDYRVIEYDLKPRSVMEKKWIPMLKSQVTKVLAADYKPPTLLRGRSVSRSEGIRSYLINARSEEFGAPPRYFDVVERAEQYCYLMGVSLKPWGTDDARKVFEDLARRNVPVKILLFAADNPGLSAMINRHLPSEDPEVVKLQTDKMAAYFESVTKTVDTFQVRRLRERLPHFQLIVTEKTALVLQYMFSRRTADSPLQQFPAGSILHHAFRDEFDTLWKLNE